jgi:hypothetical protein
MVDPIQQHEQHNGTAEIDDAPPRPYLTLITTSTNTATTTHPPNICNNSALSNNSPLSNGSNKVTMATDGGSPAPSTPTLPTLPDPASMKSNTSNGNGGSVTTPSSSIGSPASSASAAAEDGTIDQHRHLQHQHQHDNRKDDPNEAHESASPPSPATHRRMLLAHRWSLTHASGSGSGNSRGSMTNNNGMVSPLSTTTTPLPPSPSLSIVPTLHGTGLHISSSPQSAPAGRYHHHNYASPSSSSSSSSSSSAYLNRSHSHIPLSSPIPPHRPNSNTNRRTSTSGIHTHHGHAHGHGHTSTQHHHPHHHHSNSQPGSSSYRGLNHIPALPSPVPLLSSPPQSLSLGASLHHPTSFTYHPHHSHTSTTTVGSHTHHNSSPSLAPLHVNNDTTDDDVILAAHPLHNTSNNNNMWHRRSRSSSAPSASSQTALHGSPLAAPIGTTLQTLRQIRDISRDGDGEHDDTRTNNEDHNSDSHDDQHTIDDHDDDLNDAAGHAAPPTVPSYHYRYQQPLAPYQHVLQEASYECDEQLQHHGGEEEDSPFEALVNDNGDIMDDAMSPLTPPTIPHDNVNGNDNEVVNNGNEVSSGNALLDHGRWLWRRCTAARIAAIFVFVFAFVGFVPALMTTPLLPTTSVIPNADWRLHTQADRDAYSAEVNALGLISNYHSVPYILDRDLSDNPMFSRYRLVMYGVSRIWAYLTLAPKIWTPVLWADDQMFAQIMTQKWPFRWLLDPCPHGAPANLTNPSAKIRLAHVKCIAGDLVFDAQSMDDAVAFPGHYVYGSVTIFRPSYSGITKYTTASITMRVSSFRVLFSSLPLCSC